MELDNLMWNFHIWNLQPCFVFLHINQHSIFLISWLCELTFLKVKFVKVAYTVKKINQCQKFKFHVKLCHSIYWWERTTSSTTIPPTAGHSKISYVYCYITAQRDLRQGQRWIPMPDNRLSWQICIDGASSLWPSLGLAPLNRLWWFGNGNVHHCCCDNLAS